MESSCNHPDRASRSIDPKRPFPSLKSSPRDIKDRFEASRDPWRKSYADGADDSSDRSRNPLRKVQWHERAERHYVSRPFPSERDRSERGEGPWTPSRRSLEHDRDNFDKGEAMRSSGRRSYGGDYSRQAIEGSNHSPLQDERDFAVPLDAKTVRKASGYDNRPDATLDSSGKCSSSSERDGSDPRRSPSRRGGAATGRDGKDRDILKIPQKHGLDRDLAGDVARASPRKDVGLEKEGTRTLKLSPRKFSDLDKDGGMESQMSSPRRSDWSYRASPKSKGRDEVGTRTWNRSSFSKSFAWGQDGSEDRKPASQEEAWRKISPDTPAPFLHIAKRARSDRDRAKREETDKTPPARTPLQDKLDADLVVKEEETVHGSHSSVKEMDEDDVVSSKKSHVTGAQAEDSYLDKAKDAQKLDSSSSPGEKSEMEEGELEPEDEAVEEQRKELELEAMDCAGGTSQCKMDKENDCVDSEVPRHVTTKEATCQGMKVETPEVESQPNEEVCGSPKDRQNFCPNDGHEAPQNSTRSDNKESSKMLNLGVEQEGLQNDKDDQKDLQCKSTMASTSKILETGESSKGRLTLDLLHERSLAAEMRVNQWNPNRSEKGLDPSGDLTLSLFMRPGGAEAEIFKQKRGDVGSHGALPEKLEQLHKVQSIPARIGEKGLAVGQSESGKCSGYGDKQKKEKIESLQLSLALPGTSTELLDYNAPYLGGSAEPQRSFQSLPRACTHTQTENLSQTMTCTNSDGFTNSFSFSQSHSFVHNPSCSLNCTSLENQELSCGGSRQLSQGNEQMCYRSLRTQSGNEQLSNGHIAAASLSQDRLEHRRRIPRYQEILQNGNMQNYQGFPSVTGSNRSSGSNQISQSSHQIGHRFQTAQKMPGVSSQDIDGFENQGNMHKEYPDRLQQQQLGSRETGPVPPLQPESERRGDFSAPSAQKFSSLRNEDTLGGRKVINKKIGLREVAMEPISVMAQKLQELPDSFLEGLKDLAKEMLGSIEKREEFINLQEIIRGRQDLTEETLLHAHQTQLEIFVSLKTGMQAFVQQSTKPLTYKALIEIFLETRCRNIDCQLSLPVDACECRVCSQKSGFCHECMCVVCCKFDSDSHTCRWVGCDFCSHWCHADCALRMSYIAPAPSSQGTAETSEMQFQCIACGRHTELFGFVKDAFHRCHDVWGPETLAKELDCVRKIFHGSKDMRGKQLCWKAEQMLQKLESKVAASEVCRSMLRFFDEGNAELDGASNGINKQPYLLKPNEALDGMSDPARAATFKMPSSAGNKLANMDNNGAALQTYDRHLEEKRTEVAELQYDRARKKAEIEDLESIVWIKQAESKMFQMRADEARQDASGLQRIASVKLEKIEKDYACKYAKLRLHEAEERRTKRVEELQVLERAQHDYQRMKIRMEADIKNLLMKMEVTKKQFF